MPQLEVGRLTNPGARGAGTANTKRKKTTKSKVMKELEQKNAQMARSLQRLRKMNPGKSSIGQSITHAAVAGAGGVVASALGAVVTPDTASGYVKGAVKIGIGIGAAVLGEMYGGRSGIALAAAYGACGALVDRGVEALGVYEKIGIAMDGGSYYMGASDVEFEDEDDIELLDSDDSMGAIAVSRGPLDTVNGTPGRSGLARAMDAI